MRNAITLLELILVLIIMGILAKVGLSSFEPNYLARDSEYVVMRIAQAQYHGIGVDHRVLGGGEITIDDDESCVSLDTNLSGSATDVGVHYVMHTSLSGDLADQKLCFDHLGRPGLGDHRYVHLIAQKRVLILQYGGHERNITLYPKSGYVIIE